METYEERPLAEDEPYFKIGEMAAVFNVSIRAMRLYDKLGIIVPSHVDAETGYRYYRIDQLQQLNMLLDLKALGFSLHEIKEILTGNLTKEELRACFIRRQAAWLDVISNANNVVQNIEQILSNMEESKAVDAMDRMDPDERARVMSRLICVAEGGGQSMLSQVLWL